MMEYWNGRRLEWWERSELRVIGLRRNLFAFAPLRSVPQAVSQFPGLATAIHEISGLIEKVAKTSCL